ncbi:MAG: hypothetical protein Q8O03_06590, partial [Nanoarchaeota archaeon]|nr:hypothetical protein [Nanoarchaeota archaeon]
MSSLKLNESTEKFKEFYGRNIDQMPKLLGEGRTPLSTAGLMKRRLEVLTASEDVKDAWWINYFDTGDAVIYHPDGRFKVVLNAEPMKELNPKSKLNSGALALPEGMYDKLNGESFTREEIGRYGIAEKLLTKEEAKKNPIWKALAGGDQALLDSYDDVAFKKAKEQYGYDKNMKIWLSQPQEVALGRLWCVFRLGSDSFAGGNNYLDANFGRLVGV